MGPLAYRRTSTLTVNPLRDEAPLRVPIILTLSVLMLAVTLSGHASRLSSTNTNTMAADVTELGRVLECILLVITTEPSAELVAYLQVGGG